MRTAVKARPVLRPQDTMWGQCVQGWRHRLFATSSVRDIVHLGPPTCRRWVPRTCALWARISGAPVSSDTGWPKKVSRRAQAPISGDPAYAEVCGDCFAPGSLAGVFVTMDSAGLEGRRRAPRTCALWARISGAPVSSDTGWPKKVSRRAQAPISGDPAYAEVCGDCFPDELQLSSTYSNLYTVLHIGHE